MRFFFSFLFFGLMLSSFGQKTDTSIYVYGDIINARLTSSSHQKMHVIVKGAYWYYGILDTNLAFEYFHPRVRKMVEIGMNSEGDIFATKEGTDSLFLRNQDTTFSFFAKGNGLFSWFNNYFYPDKIVFSPSFSRRDSKGNLLVQTAIFNTKSVKQFSILNSQNYHECLFGEVNNNLIEYLLWSYDSNLIEFGYFDSSFNKHDNFTLEIPQSIPNKYGSYYFNAFKVLPNSKLLISGSSEMESGVARLLPIKLTVDINSKSIDSYWFHPDTNVAETYNIFYPKSTLFDELGNLFITGLAEPKAYKYPWARRFGILEMINFNNNLIIDSLYQYIEAPNATGFIQKLDKNRIILGGTYDQATSIYPHFWLKKLNLNDWYSPNVSIQEQVESKSQYEIYPNPFNQSISIHGDLNRIEQLNLYSLNGKLFCAFKISKTINLSEFDNGTYILEIEKQSGKTERHKIIKQE